MIVKLLPDKSCRVLFNLLHHLGEVATTDHITHDRDQHRPIFIQWSQNKITVTIRNKCGSVSFFFCLIDFCGDNNQLVVNLQLPNCFRLSPDCIIIISNHNMVVNTFQKYFQEIFPVKLHHTVHQNYFVFIYYYIIPYTRFNY